MLTPLKTMFKVMAIGAVPLGIALLFVDRVGKEHQMWFIFSGAVASVGVLAWIWICRSGEEAAD